MAYVKKAATAQVEVKEEVLATEVKEVVTPEVKAPAKKKQIDKDQVVECRSVVSSGLTYVSKRSHMQVDWNKYGDVEYIEVSELMTMKSSQPKFLTEPWIIIDDEDVAEYLGLKQVYEQMIPVESIELFLNTTPLEDLKVALTKAPKGSKELVADKAREMVANKTLFDLRIIEVVNEVLNIDLTMIQG
jgi:hypothetical protein